MNIFESEAHMNTLFSSDNVGTISIAKDESEISNSGKAGHSLRIKERTPLVELTDAETKKYFTNISAKDLYFQPESIPYLTRESIFSESGVLTWDLGTGRGERVIELAKEHPERHFVGVDIHYRSALLGARAAADSMLDNIHFIRADTRLLTQRIPDDTADEMSVLFPAPQPNSKGGYDDVLQPQLIEDIARIIEPEGFFEFASDSQPYFAHKMRLIGGLGLFSCELEDISHAQNQKLFAETTVRTRYQILWEKKGIATLQAKMKPLR